MSIKTLALAAIGSLALASASHAAVITISTSPFTVGNFGTSSTAGYHGNSPVALSNGVVVFTPPDTTSPQAGVYSGTTSRVATSPFGSSSTANYLVAEPTNTAVISFTAPQTSFSLLWGTVDAYNTLTFSDGTSITGSQVVAAGATSNASAYVTISGLSNITSATFSTSAVAFEFDPAVNVASVPEPASLALLGAGLAGVGFVRRRRG